MLNLSTERIGIILTLAAATGFALKTILTKLAYGYGIDSITLLTLRMTIAGAAFLAIFIYNSAILRRWKLPTKRQDWFLIFFLSFFGYYLSSYFDFSGLVYIDANLGRMILFLYPSIVVILNSIIKHEKIQSFTWLALAICYIGILMMLIPNLSSGQKDFVKGCALVFAGALTYAVYLVSVDRYLNIGNIVMYITLIMTLSSVFILCHFFLAHDLGDLRVPLPVYLLCLIMAFFSTVLPGYAISAGIAMIGASKAASISMIGPVITLALSYLILGESIGPVQVTGMALVVIGISKAK
jgi:drug/metabolite transporter (DMT)-like permease